MTIFPYAIPFLSDLLSGCRCRCALMPLFGTRNFSFDDQERMSYYTQRSFNSWTPFTLPFSNYSRLNSTFSYIPRFNLSSPELYQTRNLSFYSGGYSGAFSGISGFNSNLNSPQLYQPRISSFDFGNVRGDMELDITPISKPSQNMTTQNTAEITTQNTSKIFVNKNATPHVLTKDEYASAMNGTLTYPVIKIGGVTYYKVNPANGINKQAKNAFDRMKVAAAKDGISLNIVSGHRSHGTQINLFKKYYNGKGNHSIEETAKFSAIPGYSEHESGCAFDINTANRSAHFERSEAYKWLIQNAKKYGFELSYPENNKEGLIFEPWHWRYVG